MKPLQVLLEEQITFVSAPLRSSAAVNIQFWIDGETFLDVLEEAVEFNHREVMFCSCYPVISHCSYGHPVGVETEGVCIVIVSGIFDSTKSEISAATIGIVQAHYVAARRI